MASDEPTREPILEPTVVDPRLTDGVVVLRELRDDDLARVVEQSADPVSQRWTLNLPRHYTPDHAREFLATARTGWGDDSRWTWAVEAEGRLVGTISLAGRDDRVREVGFLAHPDSRGRGYTSRAVRLAVTEAFGRGVGLVLWRAQAGNLASRRVAWATGFTLQPGTTRVLHATGVRSLWIGTLAAGEPLGPNSPWPHQAVLHTDGLLLRPFADDDGPLVPTERDPECERWMGPAVPTRATYDDWWVGRTTRTAAGELQVWAVLGDDSTLLGGVQLFRVGVPTLPGSATLAYWLLPAARGRGVAGRAVGAVVEHAFAGTDGGGLGLSRLTAEAGADNVSSLNLLRRLGFREAGTQRAALLAPPGQPPDDTVLFELLASDDRDEQRTQASVVPVLQTARLRLRPWRDDDVPGPGEGPDPASLRFMPVGVHPSAYDFGEWLARQRHRMSTGSVVGWCVADTMTDHALGCVVLFGMGPPATRFDAELGYWLHPPARGRGYLSEALTPVVAHAFAAGQAGGLGLSRLHADIDPDNAASQAVLERAGFRRTGFERSSYRQSDGRLGDSAHFELLATDPRPTPG